MTAARREAGREAGRAAAWLLARLLPSHLRDEILGDLEEWRRTAGLTPIAVRRRYWREVLHAPRTWLAPQPATSAPTLHHPHGDPAMSLLLSDVRFAWRSMLRRKGMTFIAAGTLALGIGASTAIFSVVYPILVRTLPYPDGDRVMLVHERDRDGKKSNVGFATFEDIERTNRSFESVAAMSYMSATTTAGDRPLLLTGQRVTPAFFRVLGVQPALGRDFTDADNVRGTPNVLVLSHALWRDAFGADPRILERPVTLDGISYQVIGVMPEHFENVLSPTAQMWAPLRYNATLPWACRTCRHLRMIGRRATDVSAEAANAEVEVIARNLERDHPTSYAGGGIAAKALALDLTEKVRPALLALLAAVMVVLLVASLNVSNLLLARGASRRGEFAVRIALGAARGRIVRQLLTESVVLALVGGVLGIGLAVLGVRGLVALAPASLPRVSAVEVNAMALAFALVLTTVVGLVFGLMPALRAARESIHEGIKGGARGIAGSDRVARGAIVVSEVALAMVLLVGSGLLVRSMRELLAVDPGFEARGVLTMQVQAGAGRIDTLPLIRSFYEEALANIRQLPGVEAAALTSQLPLSGDFDGYGVGVQSRPNANPSDNPSAFRYGVSDGYFETMRIPLERGRLFTAADDARAMPVAIVSASFAERHLAGLEPLGERIRVGGAPDAPWYEIVGVVGDVRHQSLEGDVPDAVYLPSAQWQYADAVRSLVVRTAGEPAALAPAVQEAVWRVDRDQPIVRVATADALVAATAAERRFVMVLFEVFALTALVLAAAGIYGVLVGAVAQRTRELGVRAAFGATARDLIVMILREGMALAAVGVAAGILLSLIGGRAISGLLFGVTPADPATYAAVVGALLLVALAACWMPAWRASRVEPTETLRQE